MKIVSIRIGRARQIPAEGSDAWWDKPWTSGFFKSETRGAVWLGEGGFAGDEQADLRVHGGPDKAVCAYPLERYDEWATRLGERFLEPGGFGENLTLSGMLEPDVCIGDAYAVGEAVLEVSQPRQPCWKLDRRWRRQGVVAEVERTAWTGYYFRVKQSGWVEADQEMALIDRPFPDWTIARCNDVMRNRLHDAEAARALSQVPALSRSWQETLSAAVSRGDARATRDAARRGI